MTVLGYGLDLASDFMIADNVLYLIGNVAFFQNSQVDVGNNALGCGFFMIINPDHGHQLKVLNKDMLDCFLPVGFKLGGGRCL